MYRKLPLVILLMLTAFGVGVALAFSDSQTTSGGVNATSAIVDLYICEASSNVPGPPCASDDSGADEVLFEGLENLLPGQSAQVNTRLLNTGPNPWDILSGSPQISIASDPTADCNELLKASVAVTPKQGFGFSPKALDFDPTTQRIYVANGGPTTTNPGDLAVLDGTSYAFVTKLDAGWLSDFAINPTTNRIYTATRYAANPTLPGHVGVWDGLTSTWVASVEITPGGRPVVAVNPATGRIYAANNFGSGVLVIDGENHTILDTIPVDYPADIAVNETTNRVYLGSSIIDGASNSVIGSLPVSGFPLAVNPVINRVYVATGNTVSVIDGATNALITSIGVGTSPIGIAVNSVTGRIYVANFGSRDVTVIDGASSAVVATISMGDMSLDGITVNSENNRIFVAHSDQGLVSVADGATNIVIARLSRAGFLNDNHSPLPGFAVFGTNDLQSFSVHVEPGDYEDFRLSVMLPHAAPAGCSDASWNVTLQWHVQIHAP